MWLKYGTQQKIDYFLHGSKLSAESFQLHAAQLLAVNFTKEKILPLLYQQDQWYITQLEQEALDKEK